MHADVCYHVLKGCDLSKCSQRCEGVSLRAGSEAEGVTEFGLKGSVTRNCNVHVLCWWSS